MKQVQICGYETSDGSLFSDHAKAAEHEIDYCLERLDAASGTSPGPGGVWDWRAVKAFIIGNRKRLGGLLQCVNTLENVPFAEAAD